MLFFSIFCGLKRWRPGGIYSGENNRHTEAVAVGPYNRKFIIVYNNMYEFSRKIFEERRNQGMMIRRKVKFTI